MQFLICILKCNSEVKFEDNAEKITSISWTVYGKISHIAKGDSVDIIYTYDAGGNGIGKTVIRSGSTDTARTWYVRDAQGNVMSVYESGKPAVNSGHLTQSELHLYGSSRLGLLRRNLDVAYEPEPGSDPTRITMPLLGTGDSITFVRGDKLFELSNHLGNVLVTVNDKKLGVSSDNSVVDYFNPQVVSAQDYYPFGMLQPGRSYNAGGYRYGFNGKENDNEVKGVGEQIDYGKRVYDPRLGKFLSVDPLSKSFPMLTPYQYASDNPVLNIDLDGKEGTRYKLKLNGTPVLEVVNLKVYVNVTNNVNYAQGIYVGNAYENKNNVINEFHSYLVDVYNGGQDIKGLLFKPLTVNETNTPVYYNIQVIPIEASNDDEYVNNRDRINNINIGTQNDIPDDKTVDNSNVGNNFVFLRFGNIRNGVAQFQGEGTNEVVLRRDRYENRAADLEDFKNDLAHELGHKFMSRHPDVKVRNPGASTYLHNEIGGIMSYNIINRTIPGRPFSTFDPTKIVAQRNTSLILESVIKIKDVNIVFNKQVKPQ